MMKRNNRLKWLSHDGRDAGHASHPSREESQPSREGFVLESLKDCALIE
jgi:hypothetical protein